MKNKWLYVGLGVGLLVLVAGAATVYTMFPENLLKRIPEAERPAFLEKVNQVAAALGTRPEWLLAIMHYESAGTFSPSITNSLGYTGLIQFGTAAARDLGTTTQALAQMTRVEQMDFVQRYFELWARRKRMTPAQLYGSFPNLILAVFYPAAMTWTNTREFPANVRAANPAYSSLDRTSLTKNTILAAYQKRFPQIVFG
jgi:hypothetical protein